MNAPKLLAFVACGVLAAGSFASAESTDPVGFVTLTIPATDGSASQFSLHNVPLLFEVEASGQLDGVSGFQVFDTQGTWETNNFAVKNFEGLPLYFVEITSGAYAGNILPIDASTGGSPASLTLTTDVSGLSGDETYNIRKFPTVADIFSAGNEHGLVSGGDANSSDAIYLIDPSSGNFVQYYYQTAPPFAGGSGWRKAGDTTTDASNAVILNGAVLIGRNGSVTASELDIVITGDVKTSNGLTPIYGGGELTLLANPFPLDLTLADSGLYNPDNSSASLQSGSDAGNADLVYVSNSGNLVSYYYQVAPPFAGGSGWRLAGDTNTDQSGYSIGSSDAILILKRSSGDISWLVSKPY